MSSEGETTDVVKTESGDLSSASPYVCNTCKSYLCIDSKGNEAILGNDGVCSVCQDLWTPDSLRLKQALELACQTYGGMCANHFAISSISVGVPGEVNLNYRYQQKQKGTKAKPFSIYLKDLKVFLVKEVEKLCEKSHEESPPPPILSVNDPKEEQGFLSVQLLCAPPKTSERPTMILNGKKKKKRQRWRPFVTQGGDPRTNLESRIQQRGHQWYSLTDAEKLDLQEYQPPSETKLMEYHFAVSRKPIFIYGYYTKGRRDVSQSPFVVMREQNQTLGSNPNDDGGLKEAPVGSNDTGDQQQPPSKKRRKVAETLGVTSVEEQICNPIVEILGGISTQNNLSSSLPGDDSGKSSQSSNVKYGMCKFHASGREDMDVRMLVRPNSRTLGRPFCVQLIDAKRPLESEDQLTEIVDRINHTTKTTPGELQTADGSKLASNLWHGQNPYGVGVCPNKLHLAPSNAYSTLQADTETKVKHYGCHCWSERVLPKSDSNESNITSQLFPELKLPVTIQQRTPVRVVHRRANLIRERQILQLEAWRVDDHHFRLEMSTQAGTYVKEFVHGDLLRTKPSLASIMGCKTNLLLLDCEGIELTEVTKSQT